MDTLQAKSIRRREDPRLLTGRGRYAADEIRPDMLVAELVRSPYAHARVTGIDISAAADVPGVIAVFTNADLTDVGVIPGGIGFKRPDGGNSAKTDRPLLAGDRVRFVGEPVAMVVAESRGAAQEAAEAVLVDYDELPLVTEPGAAMRSGAPSVWDEWPDNIGFLWRGGDAQAADQALKQAAHVTELRFSVSRVTANSMEPRGGWAETTRDGRLIMHASHQSPFQLRTGLASIFDMKPDQVRVVGGDVGGSFGMKSGTHQEMALVCWAARRLNRPVRWISGRTEGFLTDEQAREIEITAQLGLDDSGRITALRVRWDVNLGAYCSGRSGWCVGNVGGIAGVYQIPAISAEVCGILTNTVPTAAYRGAGRPEASYTIERLIDVAARELKVNPYELRRRNLIPPEAMPYKTALTFTYDCGEFEGNMQKAAELAELQGFPGRQKEASARGKLRGIGICNCIEVAGGPFMRPGKDTAGIRLAEDGTLTVRPGAMSVGQGLDTAFAQLVSERFGVPFENVQCELGDTDLLPHGKGNGGSAALCVGGAAVSAAADKVIEKAKRIASEILEAAPADVTFQAGRFSIAGTDRSVDLAAVAKAAHDPARLPEGETPGLDETAEWQPTAVTFPNGTHICEVEIDPDTGVTNVVRYSAVEDLGFVLNPLLVSGQIHGGVVQGLGQAMGEKIVHDSSSGQMLTASFMDYQMPRADDVPEFRVATREVPTKVNPLGAKGVGEAGTVGALGAVTNAVNDALASAGIRHFDMPATPVRVWEAIQEARRG
jgi:carbon-monoxide dehydrogenase large subunit